MCKNDSSSEKISLSDLKASSQLHIAIDTDSTPSSSGFTNAYDPNYYSPYDNISELGPSASPSDVSGSSDLQNYSSSSDTAYISGLEPIDFANFPPSTFTRHELRAQLDTLARQLRLSTVASSTAAWANEASEWDPDLVTLYLTVLAMFLDQGGKVTCVKLSCWSPGASPTSNYSSQVSHSPNASKRSHGECQKIERGCETKIARRKLSAAKRTDSNLDGPSTPDDSGRGPLPVPGSTRAIQFGNAVAVSYSTHKQPSGDRQYTSHSPLLIANEPNSLSIMHSRPLTLNHLNHLTPSTPSTLSPLSAPFIPTNPADPTPQLLSPNTLFITSRPDQGMRIRILPETTEDDSETWIDIPGIWFHPSEKPSPGIDVVGCSQWLLCKTEWMALLYHRIRVAESMSNFGEDQAAEFRNKILDRMAESAYRPAFDPECNPKPEHREISYPSGDDLGVNWSASRDENERLRKSRRLRRWLDKGSQDDERENRWLWHVWKQYGLVRGWVEQPKPFGDRVRNEKDNDKLRGILEVLSRGEVCITQVGFERMRKSLAGEAIPEFKKLWIYRHRYFGGPRWEV
ncbi:hypothetical protein DSL72_001028 [Monilinia vaccinii-corymbosi]|uniref:Uncharacterized protein n=1 Tax=Monilinia vaccinii-corymbosi TaxID=61207 RepID=A0A8A3P0Y2_9HELO|nr:hypothetical protein DSL72_001028 [Monilinia vaccinii-corymbosi]